MLDHAATKSILVVDDNTELCALIKDFLSPHGFRGEAAHDGRLGLARALQGGFDQLEKTPAITDFVL